MEQHEPNRLQHSIYSRLFARKISHTHGTQPSGLSSLASKCSTYTSQILWPLLRVQKTRIRAWSSSISSHQPNKLIQWQNKPDPSSQEVKIVVAEMPNSLLQKCNKRPQEKREYELSLGIWEMDWGCTSTPHHGPPKMAMCSGQGRPRSCPR